MMIIAKFIAYGDHKDKGNPFHWEEIILNLPGSWNYDPTLPWVFKVRYDGHLGCEIYIYVDNGKVTGWCKVACWEAVSCFSKVLSKLGIQDVCRKRTEPSVTPGPWAGSVVHTKESVTLLVSEKKWEKTRSMMEELRAMMESDALDRKNLEQICGFLIYVSRTYRWMVPYLKGLHLTINSWREDRDEEGYRRKRSSPPREGGDWSWDWLSNKWYDLDMEPPQDRTRGSKGAPTAVVGVPRLRDDERALGLLTEDPTPPTSKRQAATLSGCVVHDGRR